MSVNARFLVVYFKNDLRVASLYDKYLNFIINLDRNSNEVLEHIENCAETSSLDAERWEYMFDELSWVEISSAKVYKLESEVFTNPELTEIEASDAPAN